MDAAEERDGDEESNVKKILREHRCKWKHCSNFGITCIVVGKRHFKLNSNDLKVWDMAILRGKATVHIPPVDLHPQMANSSQKRRQSQDHSSDSENGPASHPRRRSSSQNINVNLYPGSQRSKRRFHSSSSPSSPIKRGRSSRARASSGSPFSSPSVKVISLSEYIAWLVNRFSEDAEAYYKALETLQSNHIKVHQFSKLSPAEWKELDISLGIRTSLKTELLNYKTDIKRSKV